ncbi:MAG: DUF3806 domain-containing protein [Pseudomonadales bacterium]
MRSILLLPGFLLLGVVPALVMAEAGPVTLTPEDLENYQFADQPKSAPAKVKDLNIGQKFILDSHRQGTIDLMVRRLGIVSLKQDKSDLDKIQRLVDRSIIRRSDVEQWQALGVVFGDVLAAELNLHWVSYQDERGQSKALQWKKTRNFVFPVTMLSRRVQFKQEIDVFDIFEQIESDIIDFARYEELHGRI